jgi:uncharacterized protein YebE (UPF0316 family)
MKNIESVAKINHYPLVYISVVAALMFTERVNPQYIIVNMCCTKFCPNWTNDMENLGKFAYTPLSEIFLTLHHFSRNS